LAQAVATVNDNLDSFKFNAAARGLYDFIWGDYCDWYLEMAKPRFYIAEDVPERALAREVAYVVLRNIVQLLHPFMPFVTEELWSHMNDGRSEHIVVGGWPKQDSRWLDPKLEADMQQVQAVISAIRTTRAEMKIPPGKKVDAIIRTARKKLIQNLETYEESICVLGRLEKLTVGEDVTKPSPAASAVIRDAEIFIPLAGIIDIDAERQRLEKELQRITAQQEKITKKLANKDFLARAPEDVVAKEKAECKNFETVIKQLSEHFEKLVGW